MTEATILNEGNEKSDFVINLLPFDHPQKSISAGLSDQKQNGFFKIHYQDLPRYAHSIFPKCGKKQPFLFIQFGEITTDAKIVVDLEAYPVVTRKYYRYLLKQYFSEQGAFVATNYVNDLVIWESTGHHEKMYQFARTSLKVVIAEKVGPAIRVAFNGYSYIYDHHLMELDNQHPAAITLIKKVVFKRRFYTPDKLPQTALSNRHEVYPVMNRKLANALGMSTPIKLDLNKHRTHLEHIEQFVKKNLDNEDFKKVIPIENKWLNLQLSETGKLDCTNQHLIFANDHTCDNVQNGLLDYGPYRPITFQQIRVFFIYHQTDKSIRDSVEGFLNSKNVKSRLNSYTKIPTLFDASLDMMFTRKETPLDEVGPAIDQMSLYPNIGYLGIYLSPFDKYATEESEHRIYYGIKEALIQRGIASQTIDEHKMKQAGSSFRFWIPNMAMAIIAKLGGIPWILDRPATHSLLIGFGLYQTRKYDRRYIGSSVCFSNDGRFDEFDFFPEEESFMVAASLEKAIMKYLKRHTDMDRVVIHYYKEMSEEDFRPILEMMARLKPGVPVVVVRVNGRGAEFSLVRNTVVAHGLPPNGSYFHLGGHRYLLYINGFEGNKTPFQMPMPVSLGISCSNPDLLEDEACVRGLLAQVFAFSSIHWRSIRQPAIPVTIQYPKLLAENAVWFNRQVIPEGVRDLPWFL